MKALLAILLFLAVVVVIAVLTALPVMWLLNALIAPAALAAVFGTVHIGFWQALGISLLCCLLFKSASTSSSKS